MITVHMLHPRAKDLVGYIPTFLSETDPRPAREQFNTNYAHGGGWQPMTGFKRRPNGALTYAGDPPYQPVARIDLPNGEQVFIYQNSWVSIVQPDGSYEVARMD